MSFGLSAQEFSFLNEHLITPLKKQGAQIYIFGSRATGKHHKFSDIDILFVEPQPNSIPSSVITKIEIEFEESKFPYKLDLVKYTDLAKSYLEKINNEKVLL